MLPASLKDGVQICGRCGTMLFESNGDSGYKPDSGPYLDRILCKECSEDGTQDYSGREKLEIIRSGLQQLLSDGLAYLFDPEVREEHRKKMEAKLKAAETEAERRRNAPFFSRRFMMTMSKSKSPTMFGMPIMEEQFDINWHALIR